MALVLADRVKDTTTTTGTGTITLSGTAPTGYVSFGTAIGNANTTYYTITAGSEWEVGVGTYTAAGTLLSRDTVLASSAGGTTKVTFSAGTKDVFVTYPAGKSVNYDASSNVGIGNTAPGYKLEVTGDLRLGSGGDLRVGSATGTTTSGGDSQIYNDANNMIFGTGTTTAERMRLDSSGQLGIGTSSPGYRLDVEAGDTTANTGYAMRLRSNATATAAAIQFTNNAVTVENSLISCTDAGALTIQSNGGSSNIKFRTNGTERASISSDGHFGMGTSTRLGTNETLSVSAISTFDGMWVKNLAAAAATTVIWNAATSGDNLFISFSTEAAATARGSITYNRAGGLVAYNVTSDYRAKDIIGPVTDAGATIDALKVYNGKMKGATIERPMLIAHEAQEVVPYAVTGEKDAVNEDGTDKHQQMDHQSLIPLLIAEIQSLRARVAELEGN